MKNKKIVELPETNEILSRSNQLILSRYSATLVENKIMALSFKRVKLNENGNPMVIFSTDELRQLTGAKGNGFYDQLKIAAAGLMNKRIYIEDEQKQSFSITNIIQKAEFREGQFTVIFTNESKSLLYNLKSNFTSMAIDTLFSFKTNHAYRLYEILKVHEFKIEKGNRPIQIIYQLSDLKLQLNCVNTEEKKVNVELMKAHPNFDKIVNDLDTEKKFKSWYEFKRGVLEKAIKEINEKTELYVSYDPIRTGRGGKTTAIRFYLQRKTNENENLLVQSETSKRSEMVDKVKELITDVKLSKKDCILILKAADNNLDKINTAYKLAKQQKDIENFVAWMISAIKNEYEKPIEVVEGSQERAEEIQKIRKSIDEKEESLAEELWNKFKEKEDFEDFAKEVEEETGLAFYFFDSMTSAQEKNQRYVKWAEKFHKIL